MSALVQLRIGHAPLNKHLNRINCTESAACDACSAPSESVRHFVLECPAYAEQRWSMRLRLRRDAQSLSKLLYTEPGLNAIAKFITTTGRFRNTHTVAPRRR
ncbi:hypothetical protein EXIGLDRAFT_722000 [Exidia glandulosa HHB12029]|uniref:Reverse transcriptase zinc-binding domain-containing protein n=1 Tax=Exidia glandulosa HHB12029 TaxID=1314781 RepID=A0A165FIN9_EXIGL|nr:hypothetical protein EXIGLDRAFT_722000 [Exidia glandulosa HHB12029]